VGVCLSLADSLTLPVGLSGVGVDADGVEVAEVCGLIVRGVDRGPLKVAYHACVARVPFHVVLARLTDIPEAALAPARAVTDHLATGAFYSRSADANLPARLGLVGDAAEPLGFHDGLFKAAIDGVAAKLHRRRPAKAVAFWGSQTDAWTVWVTPVLDRWPHADKPYAVGYVPDRHRPHVDLALTTLYDLTDGGVRWRGHQKGRPGGRDGDADGERPNLCHAGRGQPEV
jgi:hypothetical protein